MTAPYVPCGDVAEVPATKLTGYLLNIDHPIGGGKAKFLIGQGFEPTKPEELRDALRAHVLENEVVERKPDAHGTKYVVEGPLRCPDGRAVLWRSVWIIEIGTSHPRFVTGHPMGKAKQFGRADA